MKLITFAPVIIFLFAGQIQTGDCLFGISADKIMSMIGQFKQLSYNCMPILRHVEHLFAPPANFLQLNETEQVATCFGTDSTFYSKWISALDTCMPVEASFRFGLIPLPHPDDNITSPTFDKFLVDSSNLMCMMYELGHINTLGHFVEDGIVEHYVDSDLGLPMDRVVRNCIQFEQHVPALVDEYLNGTYDDVAMKQKLDNWKTNMEISHFNTTVDFPLIIFNEEKALIKTVIQSVSISACLDYYVAENCEY